MLDDGTTLARAATERLLCDAAVVEVAEFRRSVATGRATAALPCA